MISSLANMTLKPRTSVDPPYARAVPGLHSDPHLFLPRALLIPENLIHIVKSYFEKSCRGMIFDDHGTLLTPDGRAEFNNHLCNEFDSFCFTATILVKKGLRVEFRQALSKATDLIKPILQAEHPRTLTCFLEVFIHLIQSGHPDIVSVFRHYIKSMSKRVTANGQLWGQICRLLGELDPEYIEHALAQIWKCITDTFDVELGKTSRLAVSVRLDYIKRVVTDRSQEERLLRDLLTQFKGVASFPTLRLMLNLAHNLNKQGQHVMAEELALKIQSLLYSCAIYASRKVERIECLKIISFSQFGQGKL